MINLLCLLPIIGSLISVCGPAKTLIAGYVEGEYILIAPIEIAQITAVDVQRGDKITAHQPLAQLERRDTEIAVAQAKAAIAQAKSQLADLQQGKRHEEISVIEVTLESAKAQAAEAERVLKRQTNLLKRGTTTQAEFDEASTNFDLAKTKVAELEANLTVARLPARSEAINAAEATVQQAQAVLENAEWRLAKRTLSLPKAGTVFDIIRNPGEIAGPEAPVISVLPDGAIKIRLYLPEFLLSSVALGAKLSIECDGCGAGMTASVSYVATAPEFTPPVLYSLENRQKLVYLVEARPDSESAALKPGQIVDVNFSDTQQ